MNTKREKIGNRRTLWTIIIAGIVTLAVLTGVAFGLAFSPVDSESQPRASEPAQIDEGEALIVFR